MVYIVSGILYRNFLGIVAQKLSFLQFSRTNSTFGHHKQARYGTDVTFQQAYRPFDSHEEALPYFSRKHGLCGYKVGVSVLPIVISIITVKHYTGLEHDFNIFQENLEFPI